MTDADDVQRKQESTSEDQQIAPVQCRQSRGRHGQKIKSGKRQERTEPNPQRHAARPKQRQQDRDEHDKEAGNEGGFGGRGQLEARSLKCVSAKHAAADDCSRTQAACAYPPKLASIHEKQHHSGQKKAQGQKYKNRRIGQGILDQNEGGAPNQGATDEQEIGFELLRHTRRREISPWADSAPPLAAM